MKTIFDVKKTDYSIKDPTLKSIFDHPEVGVYISTSSGKFLKLNRKFCDILGYAEKELVNMTLTDLYLPETIDQASQNHHTLFTQEKKHHFLEKKVVRKDRSILWLSFVVSPILDFGTEIYQYIGIVQDISRMKSAEEELYDAKRVLESIFDTTSAMIAYLDKDFNFIRVNKQYAAAGNHPPEFYIGKNHFALYPYTDNEMIFRRVVETGQPISFHAKPFEYQEFPKLGVTYWDWDLIPVKNSHGSVTGVILSLVDVTKRKKAEDKLRKTNDLLEKNVMERTAELQAEVAERKKTEEALRQSEQRYRQVFENTSDGIFLTDVVSHEVFRFVAFNPSLEKLAGLWSSEVCGKYIHEVFPQDCAEFFTANYKKCIALGTVFSFEEQLPTPAGSIYLYTTLMPIKDDQGKIYRILGVCRDITEYKKMSENLKQAKEEAELANDAKSEYIANMSHELRTPINVILSAIQLFDLYLKSNPANTTTKHFHHLKSMKQNCFRLLRLVNNLIDMTKIDTNFYEFNLKNHNIVNIIEVITLSITDHVKNRKIRLSYDSNIDTKIIACDIDIVERIMLNLLSNAIKFTDSNGTIEVNLLDGEEYISISVKDNGIGIPKDKQKTIFERYKQADQLLTRKQEGSGIGLSLTKSFVEMLGGKISVKSEYGLGSEFIVELPCKVLPESPNKTEVECRLNDYSSIVEKINVELSDIYSIKGTEV
ncbi:sensor histidine kinase ResE [Clostridium aceticum]|uniref:histidine kinase n=1 Tax=Clostridium aceticum TaxID=84022 RepID=A0A0G3WC19_9CLOT|nr:PAS domain-containing sensor histidine kinase [Clostridium aceticum]AKL95913.1 sensor histidine kinase ResE [Clostridium aceticum]